VKVQNLFARRLESNFLHYYLGINQILLRAIPKKKFTAKICIVPVIVQCLKNVVTRFLTISFIK